MKGDAEEDVVAKVSDCTPICFIYRAEVLKYD